MININILVLECLNYDDYNNNTKKTFNVCYLRLLTFVKGLTS